MLKKPVEVQKTWNRFTERLANFLVSHSGRNRREMGILRRVAKTFYFPEAALKSWFSNLSDQVVSAISDEKACFPKRLNLLSRWLAIKASATLLYNQFWTNFHPLLNCINDARLEGIQLTSSFAGSPKGALWLSSYAEFSLSEAFVISEAENRAFLLLQNMGRLPTRFEY